MLVVDRGVGARRVRVVGRLLHRVATRRVLGRRRLGEDRFRRRDAGRGGVASSRGQEDRDDGDDDGDDDEPESERPVPASAGHRPLDLLALEPGLLAPLGLGRAPSLASPWLLPATPAPLVVSRVRKLTDSPRICAVRHAPHARFAHLMPAGRRGRAAGRGRQAPRDEPRAAGRLRGGRGRRRGVRVLEHHVHRERGGHQRGRQDRPHVRGRGRALPARDLLLADRRGDPGRGDRSDPRDRRLLHDASGG